MSRFAAKKFLEKQGGNDRDAGSSQQPSQTANLLDLIEAKKKEALADGSDLTPKIAKTVVRKTDPRCGRGIYALVIKIESVDTSKNSKDDSMASSKTSANKNSNGPSHRIQVVVCDLSKVPVDILGEEDSEGFIPFLPLFRRKLSGTLEATYLLEKGEKKGERFVKTFDACGFNESYSLKVGLNFPVNVFGGKNINSIKIGDVLEISGWKVASTKNVIYTESIHDIADRKETADYPMCYRLPYYFSYSKGANFIPSLRNLSIAADYVRLEPANRATVTYTPEGMKRKIHKQKYINLCYFVNFPSPVADSTKTLTTASGTQISLGPVPCSEYDPSHYQALQELGWVPKTPIKNSGDESTDGYEEIDNFGLDYSQYYSAHTDIEVITYPEPTDEIIKKDKKDQFFLIWEVQAQATSWGSKKAFLDPNFENPVSCQCNMQTGLVTRADGTVDRYLFARQLISLNLYENHINQLGPTDIGKLAQILMCHKIGFSVLMHPDLIASCSSSISENAEPFPRTEAERWERNLSEEDQERIVRESNQPAYAYSHGLVKNYVDLIVWYLPEYLELNGIPISREVMERLYQTLFNETEVYSKPYTIFQEPNNNQPYTYLSAVTFPFSKLGSKYAFYALICPVKIGDNVKKQRIEEERYQEALLQSRNPHLSQKEKDALVEKFLDDTSYVRHFYAVDESMMKLCRVSARKDFLKTVTRIKEQKEGIQRLTTRLLEGGEEENENIVDKTVDFETTATPDFSQNYDVDISYETKFLDGETTTTTSASGSLKSNVKGGTTSSGGKKNSSTTTTSKRKPSNAEGGSRKKSKVDSVDKN